MSQYLRALKKPLENTKNQNNIMQYEKITISTLEYVQRSKYITSPKKGYLK